MTQQKIAVTLSTFAKAGTRPLELLEQSGIPFVLNQSGKRPGREELLALCAGATGVVAGVESFDRAVLEALPGLTCISRCGVGLDSIDLACAAERGITVRNTPQVVVQPVVELTLAMILSLSRRLPQHTAWMRRREWKRATGNLLAGRAVGILGLGAIGRRVAEVLLLLGVRVMGADVRPDTAWAERLGVRLADVDTVLREADILTLHLSVLAEAPFVLGAREIALMKPGAFVVNVSRGSLIDDAALAEALQSGRLGGAGLDVYPKEPYAGPLCDLENVVMTPHCATLTTESRLQMETEAVEYLLETLAG